MLPHTTIDKLDDNVLVRVC